MSEGLCLGLGSQPQTLKYWTESRRRPYRRLGVGAQRVKGEADKDGFVQSGEEKVQGKPYCGLQLPDGELFSEMHSDGMQASEPKLEQKSIQLDFRKNIFTVRGVQHWPRLPREFGKCWRYSKLNWP